MRAIDADAFKKYIDAQEGRPFIGCTVGEAMKILIDEQPTIQPEPHYDEWCTGFSCTSNEYATIVCYLPDGEPIYKYWDDAFDVEAENVAEIKYSERFPKPEWCE